MPSLSLQQKHDTKLPKSAPLHKIEELKDWKPDSKDLFNVASVPRGKRSKMSGPKLMLCHDFKGVNWVNTCHRNGVSCLGTVIFEHEDGQRQLEEFLNGPPGNESDVRPQQPWSTFYADKLVDIAKFYGFDGWLFNVEAGFDESEEISAEIKTGRLTELLAYLTKKIHQEIPDSSIIWYDSLANDGTIWYQNQITDYNLPFFKVVDGIYLNYGWKEAYPQKAVEYLHENARDRFPEEVYFGIDLWGSEPHRYTFGGGGFSTYKGVQVSSKHGTSSVMFAMGYTYEKLDRENFDLYDRLLWMGGDVSEYPEGTAPETDAIKKRCNGVADFTAPRAIPNDYLITWFDRGYGSAFYWEGKSVLDQPWSHLSHQGLLPNLDYRQPALADRFSLQCELSDANPYMSGTSLLLKSSPGATTVNTKEAYLPLYKANVDASSGLKIKFVYTRGSKASRLSLYLRLTLGQEAATTWEDTMAHFPLQNHGTVTGHYEVAFPLEEDQPLEGDVDDKTAWIIKNIETLDLSKGAGAHSAATVDEIGLKGNVALDETSTTLANVGYLRVTPSHFETSKVKHLELAWQEKEWQVKKKRTGRAPALIRTLWGTLSWALLLDDTPSSSSSPTTTMEGIEFFIISLMDKDKKTKKFVGTAFCTQYRISGINPRKLDFVQVEAIDRLGDVKAEGILKLD
ncbi:hypothetical protein EC973_004959 [Apophysomyces ossiformis]|uniref:Cytosolic endo-beta-N-acetylglucosaminidase TIM barrel domain-containing protein n=1 Tax=Apophysomyces ossiformis TaxID=679940 RepID=A0A8H7EM82_9FUNG|nr:hypothetical protein EC973_004959 [Apophysomyces ossiformis]